jgi:3',5'-cyclic AMP phosphodiesterase CpdA
VAEEGSGARLITRRGVIGLTLGTAGVVLAGGVVRVRLYEWFRWQGDFFPGTPPDVTLEPQAWTTTTESVTFAVLGDSGSGGRNQMAVASAMARSYQENPYGLVLLAGDISYYGSIDERWDEVFAQPYRPLIEAGVEWELAIGNHEIQEKRSEDAAAEIDAQLRRLDKPGTFYSAVHGPMEVFVIDSSTPLVTGGSSEEQLAWLESALAESSAKWKVGLLHHPPFSSGRHGSNIGVRDAVQPLFAKYGVQVAFTGHDHDYERTVPQEGVVWIVSGAGSKLTSVGRSEFTAHAESTLQFMCVEIAGDVMEIRAITTSGRVIDQTTIRADR